MSRWRRCPFCDQRGHSPDNCPRLKRTMDTISPIERSNLMDEVRKNPLINEEMNRRKASHALGNDKPVPRWKRRRRG